MTHFCDIFPKAIEKTPPTLSEDFLFSDFAIILLFYGVYFGVINKDIADLCTDKMASTIGYFSEDGMPMQHLDETTCGICGELNVGTDENGKPEKQVWTSSDQSLV